MTPPHDAAPLTPEAVAQMVADREAGTPGPWTEGRTVIGLMGLYGFIRHIVSLSWDDTPGHADARRIARLPDLEAAYLTLAAENATLRAERDDAFARGMAHGQKAMPKGTFNVVDSPELATLRASEAAAVERVRVLTEALRIAGPIALKDYARHPFILLGAEQEAVSVIERGVEALTPPKTEGETP